MQSMALFSSKKKRKKRKKRGMDTRDMKWADEWNIAVEEGREVIQQWRKKRLRFLATRNPYPECLIYSFSLDTLKSFVQNINFMVFIQIIMALLAVYIFQIFDISFDIHVSLFISPIVFPLAFSINTDFQRREKVLEDLALFKSSGLVWYFCMREWKQAAGLDNHWMTAVHYKLKSLLFHLEEYLLTEKIDHRKVILRAMYEDFSDTNQIIEQVRASKLPANTAIISRSLHLFNMMCLAFERLRVIREYRSPRSIRSFNKVFIMFLPVLLAPYFVNQGKKDNNLWEPYYVASLVAFVFSVLQGVQDKLDDPFDGMSEDDINLNTIDEWTIASLDHTLKRSFDVGRFKVTVDPKKDPIDRSPLAAKKTQTGIVTPTIRRDSKKDEGGVDYQKLAPILKGLSGNSRITRKRGSLFDASSSRRGSYNTNPSMKDDIQKLAPWLKGVAGDTRVSWKQESKIDLNASPYASVENIQIKSPLLRSPKNIKTDHKAQRHSSPNFPESRQFNDIFDNTSNNNSSRLLNQNEQQGIAGDASFSEEYFKINPQRVPPHNILTRDPKVTWKRDSLRQHNTTPCDSIESLPRESASVRPRFTNIFKEATTTDKGNMRFSFKPVVDVVIDDDCDTPMMKEQSPILDRFHLRPRYNTEPLNS